MDSADGADFVVVGAGILGTAVAALAALAGLGVVALRLSDRKIPRADTLRNQGWLQSGLLYKPSDFADESTYRTIVQRTYFGGRAMLDLCQIPQSSERGIIRIREEHLNDFLSKARLLRLSSESCRVLEPDEGLARLGALYEKGSKYLLCPDSPFDESGVLTYLRNVAATNGARFIEVDQPVALSPNGSTTAISWGRSKLESSLTLVAAGAAGFELMKQTGAVVDGFLRRTPLLVHSGECEIKVPLLVDSIRGFSAVRHSGNSCPAGAIVIGTKVREEPADFVFPDNRQVSEQERVRFGLSLPPQLQSYADSGRFTCGYEVMPGKECGTSFLEPWIEEHGNVIFASPGRATLGLDAAEAALVAVQKRRLAQGRSMVRTIDLQDSHGWDDPIHMHFSDQYSFDDAEDRNE